MKTQEKMAYTPEEKIIKDGDTEKKGFSITFTNGTLEQLEELKEFFKIKDKLEVVKLGISVLQRAKDNVESEEKEKKDK